MLSSSGFGFFQMGIIIIQLVLYQGFCSCMHGSKSSTRKTLWAWKKWYFHLILKIATKEGSDPTGKRYCLKTRLPSGICVVGGTVLSAMLLSSVLVQLSPLIPIWHSPRGSVLTHCDGELFSHPLFSLVSIYRIISYLTDFELELGYFFFGGEQLQ